VHPCGNKNVFFIFKSNVTDLLNIYIYGSYSLFGKRFYIGYSNLSVIFFCDEIVRRLTFLPSTLLMRVLCLK
jgi:hypothetical protein